LGLPLNIILVAENPLILHVQIIQVYRLTALTAPKYGLSFSIILINCVVLNDNFVIKMTHIYPRMPAWFEWDVPLSLKWPEIGQTLTHNALYKDWS